MDSKWADEDKQVDYSSLLEDPRGSGDGESKETSPHTSASEDDNQETKQDLIDVNRKAERRKDKKISKIPVWQAKPAPHADVPKSTYGNSCRSQQLDFAEQAGMSPEIFGGIYDNTHPLVVGNKIQTDSGGGAFHFGDYSGSGGEFELRMSDSDDGFAVPISDFIGRNEADLSERKMKTNATNLDNTNVYEIEKEELEHTVSKNFQEKQLNESYGSGMLKGDGGNCSRVGGITIGALLNTILEDDVIGDVIPDIDEGPELTSSLSVRAPLATEDLVDLELEELDDNILEAPEEFRSLRANLGVLGGCGEFGQLLPEASDSVCHLQLAAELEDETAAVHVCSDVGEPKQCRIGAPGRDHDKASTPEAGNVCGRESNNKDVAKNAERGIEMGIASNRQEPKPLRICMTNEGKHSVIQLQTADRKVNANECAKFAAPCETMEIMRRVFTDVNGGESEDNGQIQNDSIIASETKPHVEVCDTHQECTSTVSSSSGNQSVPSSTPSFPNSTSKSNLEDILNAPDKEPNEIVELRNNLGKLLVSFATPSDGESASRAEDKASARRGGNSNATEVTLPSVSEPCADNSCPEGRDLVNGSSSSVSNIGACAGNEQTPTTAKASIAIGVARRAQAPRCSRISVATACAASTADCSNCSSHNPPDLTYTINEDDLCENSSDHNLKRHSETPNNYEAFVKTESANIDKLGAKRSDNFGGFGGENQSQIDSYLVWQFKNGRLVFEAPAGPEALDSSDSGQSAELGQVSQCQSEDTTAPPLLQIIEKCVGKIESSVSKISEIPDTHCDADGDEVRDVLCSRDLNRRVVEGRSRLKHLENKLKEAGITDGKTNIHPAVNRADSDANKSTTKHVNETSENKEKVEQVVDKLALPCDNENLGFDDNQNVVCSGSGPVATDLKTETQSASGDSCHAEDLLPETDASADQVDFAGGGSLCQFDVRQVGSFAGFPDNDFFVVYDELEDSSDEDDCQHEHYHIISKMRGDGSMGTDGDRVKQHNPDRENLKSLLKKPGRGRDVKKNRVVFNENKNEFFDADYIILIREECDYDDEEDDGVCTCNEHEMVRLTCCEPNCNCNIYEGYSDPTPQSPKFAPPLEFVDAVTLSPPEGYKDMELGEQQLLALQQMTRRGQRTAVCRDCSATHEDDGEGSQSDNEDNGETQSDHEEPREETEKTDQSQQTTPTTPPPSDIESLNQHQYIMETVTMTTVTERRIMREMEDEKQRPTSPNGPPGGSPISGILKGGRLWKQHSQEVNNMRNIEQQATDSSVTSDEESNGNRRSVRFIEAAENKRDCCDGAVDKPEEESAKQDENIEQKQTISCNNSVSPESTEMMLTFKLGNHILISNNSLKPNSAVRQLFPCSKPLSNKPGDNDSVHQYLVTAESLRAFEEAKRSKLPQIIQSDDTDESIKRAIERNTLRRSLIRYEPRPKKKEQKTDNSLVERIKQLTCDVDDVVQETEDIPQRASPPGEEARKSPEVNHLNKNLDKSFSPSSSSTASSNSSSVSSTYKKITDLFAKREKPPDIQNNTIIEPSSKTLNQLGPAPDLGNTGPHQQEYIAHHCPVAKTNSTSDARKQFLSTLAPLTACVSGTGADDHYYHVAHHPGDRASVTSSVGTEYSLEDIDEGLKNEDDDTKRNAPDVVVGTPSASESGDELAMFVQQDASRIERIKKKYQQENSEDDEHDDYGFNKRPSVRGIKPRFGTTTEILQQIQNQIQPPQPGPKTTTHVAWPYYSEASLSALDNNKSRNINQNVPQYQYTYVTEEMKTKMYVQHYRPTTLVEDNMYQNCTNQRCNREVAYKTNANHVHSPVMRIGGGCSEFHQVVPGRSRNGRPESPPPFDVARNIHQTMVYIPYNHIETYQPTCVSPNPNPQYPSGGEKCYARVVNQNQLNNRYVEPLYHNQPPRMSHPAMVDESHYQVNVMKQVPKPMMRLPYPLPTSTAQPHLMNSRSDSPLPGQFSTARSTQTSAPAMATCNYYPAVAPRYRPAIGPVVAHAGVVWNSENMYGSKVNRHSFPSTGPRYPAPDNISLTDSESQYSGAVPNGFRQSIETTFSAQKDSVPNSPTKPRFIERGVPEGAASVSPQDSTVVAQSTSTMTSPTSPQNPQQGNPKPLFYAMNV